MFGLMLEKKVLMDLTLICTQRNIGFLHRLVYVFVSTTHVLNCTTTVVNLAWNICGQTAQDRLVFTAVKFF